MKWLLGALVLLNLGFLMWGAWYREPLIANDLSGPRPNVAADKLKLLSEPGVRLIVREKNSAPATATVTSAPCYRLGPFPALERVNAASVKLAGWGIGYERVAEFETLGLGYRLYIPSFPSKEQAEAKRRELTALGFTDHALIDDEPGMKNAIALGQFTVEQNAQARQQQLAGKGIKAMLQPVPNVRPIYWLALSTPAVDDKIGNVPFARFNSENWGVTGVSLAPAQCRAAGGGT